MFREVESLLRAEEIQGAKSLQDFKSKLAITKQQLADEKKNRRIERDTLKKQIDEQTKKMNDMRFELKTREDRVRQLHDQVSRKSGDIKDTKSAADTAQESLRKEISRLHTNAEKQKAAYDEQCNKIQQQTEEISRLKTEIELQGKQFEANLVLYRTQVQQQVQEEQRDIHCHYQKVVDNRITEMRREYEENNSYAMNCLQSPKMKDLMEQQAILNNSQDANLVSKEQMKLVVDTNRLEMKTKFASEKQRLLTETERECQKRLQEIKTKMQNEYKESNEATRKQMEQVKEALDNVNQSLELERTNKVALESDLREEKRTCTDLRSSLDVMTRQLEESEKNRDVLVSHLEESGKNLGCLKSLAQDQQGKIVAHESKIKDLLAEKELRGKSLTEGEATCQSLESKLEQKSNKLQELHERSESLKQEYADYKQTVEQNEKDNRSERLKKLKFSESVVENLQKEISELTETTCKQIDHIATLEGKNSHMENERQELLSALHSNEHEYDQAKAQFDRCIVDHKENADLTMSSMSLRCEELCSEVISLKSSFEEEKQTWVEKESNLHSEKDALKSEYEKTCEKMALEKEMRLRGLGFLEQQIQRLRDENKNLKTKVLSCIQDMGTQSRQWIEDICQRNKERTKYLVRETQHSLKLEAQKREHSLQRQLENQRTVIENRHEKVLNSKLTEAETVGKDLNRVEESLVKSMDKADCLSSEKLELEDKILGLSQTIQDKDEAIRLLEHRLERMQEEKAIVEQEVEDTKNVVKEKDEQIKDIVMTISSHFEVPNFEDEISFNIAIAQLRESIRMFIKSQQDSLSKSAQVAIKPLQTQIFDKQKRVAEMQREVVEAKEKLSVKERELSEANKEIERLKNEIDDTQDGMQDADKVHIMRHQRVKDLETETELHGQRYTKLQQEMEVLKNESLLHTEMAKVSAIQPYQNEIESLRSGMKKMEKQHQKELTRTHDELNRRLKDRSSDMESFRRSTQSNNSSPTKRRFSLHEIDSLLQFPASPTQLPGPTDEGNPHGGTSGDRNELSQRILGPPQPQNPTSFSRHSSFIPDIEPSSPRNPQTIRPLSDLTSYISSSPRQLPQDFSTPLHNDVQLESYGTHNQLHTNDDTNDAFVSPRSNQLFSPGSFRSPHPKAPPNPYPRPDELPSPRFELPRLARMQNFQPTAFRGFAEKDDDGAKMGETRNAGAMDDAYQFFETPEDVSDYESPGCDD